MTITMSFAISTPTSSLLHSSSSSSSSPSSSTRVKTSCFSNPAISIPKNAIFQQIKCIPQLGYSPFSQWNGLKHMGLSISPRLVKMERKGKCKGKGVFASLFGVGAPEVLVIGVVALLVFGPKGLAEVARNLGKTLRAFQPTIRELQEVSREFKSTLEREIGLDDIDTPVPKRNTPKPTPEESGTDIEPNGSSSETAEVAVDSDLKLRADRFTGALAQLQKEQEEERIREEEEKEREKEKEKDQSQAELQTPSEDTIQALDALTATTAPSENPDTGALQEAASVAPTNASPNAESQS